MPLLDHFHPPLSNRRPWSGFHSGWANTIAFQLNRGVLPSGYSAIAEVRLGGNIEIDAAVVNEDGEPPGSGGDVPWHPAPIRSATIDLTDLDVYEVRITRDNGEVALVAAIELVSPRNKDRATARHAFANKCASYLQQGVGLVVVDVVTERQSSLYEEIVKRIDLVDEPAWTSATGLYAVSFHAIGVNAHTRVDWWPEMLSVGFPLPRLPLWISPDKSVPLDLEATYMSACESLKVPFPRVEMNGA